jgi:hypothetical protein
MADMKITATGIFSVIAIMLLISTTLPAYTAMLINYAMLIALLVVGGGILVKILKLL